MKLSHITTPSSPRFFGHYMHYRRSGCAPKLAAWRAAYQTAHPTNAVEFCLDYRVLIPARRMLDFRMVKVEANHLYTHNMFGETRLIITDGVHAYAYFPAVGVKEVVYNNLIKRTQAAEPDQASNLASPKQARNTKLKLILDLI